MAFRMVVQTTSRYEGTGFREEEVVKTRRQGVAILHDELGGIDPKHQTEQQYLDELARLGILVTFTEI